MHPLLFSITQVEPIWADLIGGMDRLPDLADITTRFRTKLNKKAELRRAIARDNSADESSPLQAGASLIFRIQSQVSFKDRAAYRNVSVSLAPLTSSKTIRSVTPFWRIFNDMVLLLVSPPLSLMRVIH